MKDMDSISVLDWLEWVLGALLSVLERGLKAEFIALMEPLMDLALLLNPLPEYQLTQDIRDGDQPMRWGEVKVINGISVYLLHLGRPTFRTKTCPPLFMNLCPYIPALLHKLLNISRYKMCLS